MSEKYKPRWFHVSLDQFWVVCQSCRTEFLRASVERRRKCPYCGRDNYGNVSENRRERHAKMVERSSDE